MTAKTVCIIMIFRQILQLNKLEIITFFMKFVQLFKMPEVTQYKTFKVIFSIYFAEKNDLNNRSKPYFQTLFLINK